MAARAGAPAPGSRRGSTSTSSRVDVQRSRRDDRARDPRARSAPRRSARSRGELVHRRSRSRRRRRSAPASRPSACRAARRSRYENPRSARSSCGLLTPRSIRIPITCSPSPCRSTSVGELLESSVHHVRPRSPKGASRGRATATASASRSIPSSRTSGRASSSRPRGPAPPTVQSTISPVRNGQEELHHLPGHHREMRELRLHILLLDRFAGTAACRRPRLQPPGRPYAARDVSPGRQRLKAGGVGANNRAGRGAGDGPGEAGSRHLSRRSALEIPDSDRTRRSRRCLRLPTIDAVPSRSFSRNVVASQISMWSNVAGDDHVAVEVGEVAQVRRDGDATLLVGRDLHRAGEEGAGGLALRSPPRWRDSVMRWRPARRTRRSGRRRGSRRAPSPSPHLPRAGRGSAPGG